ncbi:hypothetical protein SAMN05216266_101620 [Amycolatopsis marina]|uniref:Transmembrane protein n=1 Tax=Amycolatopsis marina TaxID=490629 RepID=A0A1I0W0M8_9PSEU|nr:hypothetical protein [Amycolatopsis marina]SFA81760.1 hypothetical protein SAMN05216266_101620 [Amycolatopsis marina]
MQQQRSVTRMVALLVALAALTVAVWWVWLGLDNGYKFDQATQTTSGPYEAPQVIGCVVSLIVLAAAAGWLLPVVPVVVTMTVAFGAAWSVNAATSDASGLWAVGAALVTVGVAAGATVIALGMKAIRRRYKR